MSRSPRPKRRHLSLAVLSVGWLCSCGATRESTPNVGAAGASAALAGHAGELSNAGGSGGEPTNASGTNSTGGATPGGGHTSGGTSQCLADGSPPNDPNAKRSPVSALRALAIEAPAPPTTCEHPPQGGAPQFGEDACGCAGLSCKSPQVCVNAVLELGAACGQPTRANQCFTTCASDADCAGDEICLPAFEANEVPHCFKARCRSDSECCSGSCLVFTGYFSQCHSNAVLGIDCR